MYETLHSESDADLQDGNDTVNEFVELVVVTFGIPMFHGPLTKLTAVLGGPYAIVCAATCTLYCEQSPAGTNDAV